MWFCHAVIQRSMHQEQTTFQRTTLDSRLSLNLITERVRCPLPQHHETLASDCSNLWPRLLKTHTRSLPNGVGNGVDVSCGGSISTDLQFININLPIQDQEDRIGGCFEKSSLDFAPRTMNGRRTGACTFIHSFFHTYTCCLVFVTPHAAAWDSYSIRLTNYADRPAYSCPLQSSVCLCSRQRQRRRRRISFRTSTFGTAPWYAVVYSKYSLPTRMRRESCCWTGVCIDIILDHWIWHHTLSQI